MIARTNATLFDKAVQLSKSHILGFVGGIQGYRLNSLKDVCCLYSGRPDRIRDPYLKSFKDYGSLKSYAEAVEEIELLGICKVVEHHGWRLPGLVDAISAKAVEAKDAQVVLTTAHKAKGLQWSNVLLMGDFLDLVRDGQSIDPSEVDADEFNLIYVAITRTINNLRLDKDSSLPAFIELVREKRITPLPSFQTR